MKFDRSVFEKHHVEDTIILIALNNDKKPFSVDPFWHKGQNEKVSDPIMKLTFQLEGDLNDKLETN